MKKVYSALTSLIFVATLSAQTATFNFTGSVQTFTVPSCVTTINVDAYGASGGFNNSYAGGSGGRVQATIAVTPGEVLQIVVGEVGFDTQGNHAPVYGGGGGVYSYSSGGTSGTGGGATDIRRAPYAAADRLVVAGGGGGGGYQQTGGHGGGLIGMDGIPFPTWPNSGGKGGSQVAGGQQGIACCSCPTYTTAGSFDLGGNGAGDGAGGGGGGGGYYGGGGSCFAGGGGGSSYTEPSATSVTHTQGFQSGAGMVVISYVSSGSIPTTPAGVTGPSSVCVGTTDAFSIGAVAGALSYTWTVPAGTTINSGQGTTAINVTFGSTSGNVTVTADNSCGSSPAATYSVTINANPVVALGADTAICGSTLLLNAGNGGSTYLWSNSTTAQTLSATTSGTYSVLVTTVNGCTGSDAIVVTMNTPPTVALGADVTQCGGTVLLDAGNAGSTFLWSTSATTQTLPVNTSGSYNVMVTDANGCTDNDTVMVTINPIPTVTGSAANDTACVADGPIALMGMPMSGTWSGPGVSGNQFDPATAGVGTHTALYVYVDAMTCTDSASVAIVVDICLGVADNTVASAISLYPNPVTEQLQVNSDQPLLSYSVLDVSGRQVMTGSCNSAVTIYINVQELAAGTYVLQTTGVNGVIVKTQFVKK